LDRTPTVPPTFEDRDDEAHNCKCRTVRPEALGGCLKGRSVVGGGSSWRVDWTRGFVPMSEFCPHFPTYIDLAADIARG
jgi:hypothetical protein